MESIEQQQQRSIAEWHNGRRFFKYVHIWRAGPAECPARQAALSAVRPRIQLGDDILSLN